MATLVKPSSPQRSLRRLLQRVRSYYAHGEITALVIAVLLLLMPALSLNSAGWLLDMRTLLPVAALSVFFGFVLARSQYNELIGLIITTI